MATQAHWSRILPNLKQVFAAAVITCRRSKRRNAGALTRASKHDYILLYGSLCRDLPAHRQLGLDKSLRFIGVRTVPGILYDLGEYPGLVAGCGTVRAELYRIDDVSVLSRIDEFEEYDPARLSGSLYRRTTLQVARYSNPFARWLCRPRTIDAWVFVYNRSVDGRPRVDSPSWVEYQARRSSAAAREAAAAAQRAALRHQQAMGEVSDDSTT